MKKKTTGTVLSLVAAAVMALSMAACGNSAQSNTADEQKKEAPVTETSSQEGISEEGDRSQEEASATETSSQEDVTAIKTEPQEEASETEISVSEADCIARIEQLMRR